MFRVNRPCVLAVTGTDTGVGKTCVSSLLISGLMARGRRVGVLKPFATGDWNDARALRTASGKRQPLASVVVRFDRPPLAPAAVAGTAPSASARVDKDIQTARTRVSVLSRANDIVIVEGLGGLLAPLGGSRTVADVWSALGCPLWVVARPGLGTLNHTLLTLEAARRRRLKVRRVVVSGVRPRARVDQSNLTLLKTLAGVPVTAVPVTGTPRVQGGANALAASKMLASAFVQDTLRS